MSGYDFSPLYRSSLSAFSPGSTFLATAHQNRLIVRSTHNLSIVRAWDLRSSTVSNTDGGRQAGPSGAVPSSVAIDEISWSDDGLYILVVSLASQTVWVYGIAEEGEGADGEVARIQPGPEGLEAARWAKGGREVICWSEHSMRVTIHDISERTSSCLNNPKGSVECHAVDPNGRYLAMLETHASSEHIGVYDLQDGCTLVRHFPIATSNAQMIHWSPCGKYIAIAETWLSYQLYIYSPIGPLISAYPTLKPEAAQSTKPSRGPTAPAPKGGTTTVREEETSIGHMGLGVKCMAWCPSGRAILVGGWEGSVEVVDPITANCLSVIEPKRRVGKGVEPVDWLRDTRSRGIVQFDRLDSTTLLPCIPANLSAAPPVSGPTHLLPSPSGAFLALAHATQPRAVHIYALCPSTGAMPDINHLGTMILREGVRDVRWVCKRQRAAGIAEANNGGDKLMVVSKSGGVFVWDKDGWVDEESGAGVVDGGGEGQEGEAGVVEGVGIPNAPVGFAPTLLHISPDGRAIVIQSRKDFCVMYDEDEPEATSLKAGPRGGAAPAAVISAVEEMQEKEWESEGLSLVMEGEEEEEEEDVGGPGGDSVDGIAAMGRRSYSAYARGRGERMSVLQEPAWRPADVRA